MLLSEDKTLVSCRRVNKVIRRKERRKEGGRKRGRTEGKKEKEGWEGVNKVIGDTKNVRKKK